MWIHRKGLKLPKGKQEKGNLWKDGKDKIQITENPEFPSGSSNPLASTHSQNLVLFTQAWEDGPPLCVSLQRATLQGGLADPRLGSVCGDLGHLTSDRPSDPHGLALAHIQRLPSVTEPSVQSINSLPAHHHSAFMVIWLEKQ